MNLTTKGRYAITAMLDLALHYKNKPIALSEIAARQGLSLSYLDQLFSKLKQAKLITSYRGSRGGYGLAKDTQHIMIFDIILAVNEGIDATRCQGKSNCQDGSRCLTHHLWTALSDEIYRFLNNVSIAQLIDQHCVQQVANRQDKLYMRNIRKTRSNTTNTILVSTR
ncbi:MAG: Rrf2 family transcriptional regulator [Endozoicomonadaceae bacterium]|nr:Rrf2 family transcriptional regulator [Endozoicomonadaceae bacterium]MBE8232460.1 Rrf2 family transcriptional regulator [Endozoicomonadaceae bacterium]